MKNHRAKSGFSVVELITVIAVIGLLLSMSLPMVNKANHSIRLTKSKIRITQMVDALKSYYREYGCWPDGISVNEVNSLADKGVLFSSMLTGNLNYVDNSPSIGFLQANPKRLKFMEINQDDLYKQNGAVQKDKFADRFNNPAIYAAFVDPNLSSGKIPQTIFNAFPSIKDRVPVDGLNETVAIFSYAGTAKTDKNTRNDAVDMASWE